MTDDIAPTNRTLFVSPAFYTKVKQLVIQLPQGDNKQQVLGQGVQGKIDGFTVVVVPTKFLQGVEAIAVAGQVCASPLQVNQTKQIAIFQVASVSLLNNYYTQVRLYRKSYKNSSTRWVAQQ